MALFLVQPLLVVQEQVKPHVLRFQMVIPNGIFMMNLRLSDFADP